jgi:hypothetical protein
VTDKEKMIAPYQVGDQIRFMFGHIGKEGIGDVAEVRENAVDVRLLADNRVWTVWLSEIIGKIAVPQKRIRKKKVKETT